MGKSGKDFRQQQKAKDQRRQQKRGFFDMQQKDKRKAA